MIRAGNGGKRSQATCYTMKPISIVISVLGFVNCITLSTAGASAIQRILSGELPITEIIAVSTSSDTNVICIRGALQTNTFFSQQYVCTSEVLDLSSLDWGAVGQQTSGASYSNFWALGNVSVFIADKATSAGLIPTFPTVTNNATAVASEAFRMLEHALNLGIGHAKAGTFKWKDRSFEATLDPLFIKSPSSKVLTGVINLDPHGRIRELQYTIPTQAGREYLVEYEYEAGLTNDLPRVAHRYLKSSGIKNHLGDIIIYSLIVGLDDKLPHAGYLPSAFLENRAISSIFINSNNVDYFVTDEGKLRPVGDASSTKSGTGGRKWLLSGAVLSAVVFLTLLWRRDAGHEN